MLKPDPHKVVSSDEASAVLSEIADYLEFKNENQFKVRAFQNASRLLRGKGVTLNDLWDSGELAQTKGIGKGILEKLDDLLTHGHSTYLHELKAGTPRGLNDMLRIPGLGPKRLRILYEQLKIDTVEKLEAACKDERVANLKGFGEKTAQNILRGIEFLKKHSERLLYSEVFPQAHAIVEALRSVKGIDAISLAGSLRRHLETAKDVDIVVGTKHPEKIIDTFVAMECVDTITSQGETKGAVVLKTGLRVDLRAVSTEQYPYALHHFTGSKEHNTALRSRAKAMGMKMNEYGLFKGDQIIPCKDEAAIFKKLGLHYIPPELRENLGEIEEAENHGFDDLIEETDLQGVLHVHSTYSDGRASLEDMVKAAIARKLKYIGFSDHSQSAGYANGLKPDRIKQQRDEIEQLREKYQNITIFHGIESDILKSGALDYTDKVLESFDFIVGSVHGNFTQSESEMTKRVIKALQNPFCTILGHPTGRLLLAREPFPINMEEVIIAAAELGKVIEVNANPHRFDLDWRLGAIARKHGLITSINPDAHSEHGIDDMLWGVGIARKAGFRKKDVLNAKSAKDVKKFFENAKKSR